MHINLFSPNVPFQMSENQKFNVEILHVKEEMSEIMLPRLDQH